MEFKIIAILLAILFAACAITLVNANDVETGKEIDSAKALSSI